MENETKAVEQEVDFFAADTSQEAIEDAGWTHWGGYGGWYGFEKIREGQPLLRFSVPFWIRQAVTEAFRNGEKSAQNEMKRAIGLP